MFDLPEVIEPNPEEGLKHLAKAAQLMSVGDENGAIHEIATARGLRPETTQVEVATILGFDLEEAEKYDRFNEKLDAAIREYLHEHIDTLGGVIAVRTFLVDVGFPHPEAIDAEIEWSERKGKTAYAATYRALKRFVEYDRPDLVRQYRNR
jgi:hypothetical protein